jgi:hypothetical protein
MCAQGSGIVLRADIERGSALTSCTVLSVSMQVGLRPARKRCNRTANVLQLHPRINRFWR